VENSQAHLRESKSRCVYWSSNQTTFKDQQFEAVLSDKEKAAWQSFEKILNGFLGNFKAANFKELV